MGRCRRASKWNEGKYSAQSKFIVDTLSTKDVRELERLGTALLLNKEFPNVDQATLASKIVERKTHVPDHLALDAIRDVAEIEQAARAAGLISQ